MVIFVNANERKCIEKVSDNAKDSFQLRSCWLDNEAQKAVYNADGSINFGSKSMVITKTDNIDVVWNEPNEVRAMNSNDRSGFGKDGYFDIEGVSGKTGLDAINHGLFKIKNKYYSGTRLDQNNGIVTNKDASTSKSQNWIALDLLVKCDARGIPIEQCSADALKDCSNFGQNASFEECPEKFCEKNVSSSQCQNWCSLNPGRCDAKMKEYCSTHSSEEICGCYDTSKYMEIKTAMEKANGTFKIGCLESCSRPGVFKPLEAINTQCPPQTLCVQGINTGSIGGKAEIANVTFSCSNTTTGSNGAPGGATTTGATPPVWSPLPEDRATTTGTVNPTVIAGIVVAILLFLLLVVAVN